MPERPSVPALVAAVVTAGLILAGCSSSDEDRAISTAEDFFGALTDVDATKACELNLGADGQPLTQEHADWQGCIDAVDTWASNTVMPADGELPQVSFDSIEIDDDTAHIPDAPPAELGFTYAFDLKKVDDEWYVDGQWHL